MHFGDERGKKNRFWIGDPQPRQACHCYFVDCWCLNLSLCWIFQDSGCFRGCSSCSFGLDSANSESTASKFEREVWERGEAGQVSFVFCFVLVLSRNDTLSVFRLTNQQNNEKKKIEIRVFILISTSFFNLFSRSHQRFELK